MGTRRPARELKRVFSIIVDGETEKWYLDLLKEHEKDRLPKIHIQPEIPKRKKLGDLERLIRRNAKEYDIVFWIVDLDALIHNDELESFRGIVLKLREIENVRVLVNNPCLEFWFLLHLKETSKIFTRCSGVEKELRKHTILEDYEKTEKYFKSSNDIYKKLKPFQNRAIINAKKLGELSLAELHFAKAEINQIFDLIFI